MQLEDEGKMLRIDGMMEDIKWLRNNCMRRGEIEYQALESRDNLLNYAAFNMPEITEIFKTYSDEKNEVEKMKLVKIFNDMNMTTTEQRLGLNALAIDETVPITFDNFKKWIQEFEGSGRTGPLSPDDVEDMYDLQEEKRDGAVKKGRKKMMKGYARATPVTQPSTLSTPTYGRNATGGGGGRIRLSTIDHYAFRGR